MKKKYFLIPILILCLAYVIYILYPGDNKPPVRAIIKRALIKKRTINPHVNELLYDYDKAVKKLMKEAHTPGAAIAIIHDSTVVFIKGFGVKSTVASDKVDVHTVFRIASVSKCFASMLTGILVQDTILRWDDKIVKYLPDFSLKSKQQTDSLTIEHVLSHTTGLPYHTFTNMVEEGKDIHDLLAKLKEVNLVGEVGKVYSYQNVAYSLVGEVMKSATGKSYEDLMRERVFAPLKMSDASISYDAIMSNPNISKPHRQQRKNGWVPTKITNTYYNVSPAGGINASITDMANWVVALLGDRNDIINDKTLDEIYTPHVKARSKNRNYGRMHRLSDSYYALGWRVLYYPDDTLIYHGGYVNGYRSEVAINRKANIGICILANAPGELADNGIPMFFNMYNQREDSIQAWYKRKK